MTVEIITIETPGLGNRSYLAHDGSVAVVVDPPRDIDRLLDAADRSGVTITHVLETHVHNDFVSGGLALCRRVGAELVAAAGSDLFYEFRAVRDGDRVEAGLMRLRAVHTPGHTHEHLAYVLNDGSQDVAVFTGGSLLYGTVGRTDLLGEEETDPLTRAQWASARRLITGLESRVAVCPTHGFGSFCSSQGGADRDSGTIADEAEENLAFQFDDVDAFVKHLLDGLSDHPAYYAHMALLNRAGAGEPDLGPPTVLAGNVSDAPHSPVSVSQGPQSSWGHADFSGGRRALDTVRRRLEAGEWVLDLRNRRAFAAGHLLGSVGFEIDGPFVTYVGWLIPWGSRITLIADDPEAIARAQRELVRIGIDRPSGAAVGSLEEIGGGHPTGGYRVASFADLALEPAAGIAVVDVRRADEWQDGHIDGSVNIPIHQLLDHLHHVPAGQLWVHCASGARAAIAAGILHRAGHDVVLVDDDFDNAASAGLAIE